MLKKVIKKGTDFSRGFCKDPLSHWPFVSISEKSFGNTAGFKQNFYGSIFSGYHRLSARPAANIQSKEASINVNALRKNGLVKLDNAIDKTVINKIRKKADKLYDEIQNPTNTKYIKVLAVDDIVKHLPEVFEVFNKNIIAIINGFFNSHFHIDEIVTRKTVHVPKNVLDMDEVYSNFWHCDSSPTCELAMFINLSDVTNQDGPTEAINKINTKKIIRKGKYSRDIDFNKQQVIGDKKQIVKFTGDAGAVMFAQTTKCLHRASIPEEGHVRDWLSFRLYPTANAEELQKIYKSPIYKYTHGK